MKYTIGDVLTVIGVIFGILVSVWAVMIAFSLLFPKKSESAKREIQSKPYVNFFFGLVMFAAAAFGTAYLLNFHYPLITLIAWLSAGFWLSVMAIGGSGFALLVAERIKAIDPDRSTYRGIERGALLLVVSCGLLPVIGWFIFTPVVAMISFGAGVRALFFGARESAYIPSAVVAGNQDSSR
ncbi:MAG: hypothetical protein ABJA67_00410 [Chthonomonadales bacterium]